MLVLPARVHRSICWKIYIPPERFSGLTLAALMLRRLLVLLLLTAIAVRLLLRVRRRIGLRLHRYPPFCRTASVNAASGVPVRAWNGICWTEQVCVKLLCDPFFRVCGDVYLNDQQTEIN
jgi:hypothetical protein